MIFNETITTVQNQINSNASLIDSLQQQIEDLRQQNLQLENHLQALGTAEAASQSAIEQVKTAYQMVSAIDPSQIEVFKSAIDALFAPQSPKLIEAGNDEESSTTTGTTPQDPQDDEDPTVTISEIVESLTEPNSNKSEVVANAIKERADGENLEEMNGKNGHTDLSELSVYELRDICTAKGIVWKCLDGKNMTKKEMISKLS